MYLSDVPMKGITAVISIILLLLITISLVGFAFIYFTRVTEIASQRTQEQLEHVISAQQMVVVIDNIAGNTLVIRNRGSISFGLGNVSVYANNTLASCTWSPASIAPSGVATCTMNPACGIGGTVRVTSPGGEDAEDCTS